MTKQKQPYIAEFEELVLLAILKLASGAYGAAIHEALEDAGRRTAIGALYTTLSRLEEKGLVTSWMGEATAERGGRAKKFFKIQASGMRALRETENSRRILSPRSVLALGSLS
jgi:PadR family transcriptional regulator PadR